MTRRIDQFTGAMVLQHHDEKFDVNTRSAMWAVRLVEQSDDPWTRWQADYKTLGDIVCATTWPSEDGEENRALPCGWAFAWPARVTEYHKGGQTDGDERSAALPIRKDDMEVDERFEHADHVTTEWRSRYPKGYICVSIGGVEEQEQHRLLLSADDAIICPGRNGPGVMGTLVTDLEPEATMSREGVPGVGGRSARVQTAWRVVRMGDVEKLNMTTPHNSVAWNLGPTEQEGVEAEKGKGFLGMGVVYGLENPKTTKKPITGDLADGVGGPEAEAVGSADGVVALADHYAEGPLSVGNGYRDKHRHGITLDSEPICPLHIDTNAYFADRLDEEKDAPLDFDPKTPYAALKDWAIPTRVHLRYSLLDSHRFMDENKSGLWRWETTVPYYGSGPPGDDPVTPGTPGDDPVTPGTPGDDPPTTGGGGEPNDPDEPGDDPPTTGGGGEPNDPDEPVTPPSSTTPSPTTGPAGPDPLPNAPSPTTPSGGSSSQGTVISYSGGSGIVEAHVMHPATEAFASVLWRPQAMTGAMVDTRAPNASAAAVLAQEDRRPVVAREEPWGAEAGGEWAHAQQPGNSRYRGGTAPGGVLFMPPGVDMADLGDSFVPPGPTPSTAYKAFAPGTYLAFGIPDQASGDMADCSVRIGKASNGDTVIQGKDAGAWTSILTIPTADKRHTSFGGTDAVGVPSGTTAQRPSSPVAGDVRYNSDDGALEYRSSVSWIQVGARKVVEDHTGNDTLTAAEHDSTHTNAGAGATIKFILPVATTPGRVFTFVVMAAQTLEIEVSNTGSETIRQAASTGTILSQNTVGRVVTIQGISSTEWIVTSTVGTWTLA